MLSPAHIDEFGIVLGGITLVLAYLYVGKAFVGPDDNYWGPLRRTLLPHLDRILHEHGGYAVNKARGEEFVGVVDEPPERVERYLYRSGYLWNFAAGLKTNPDDRVEYSSWAKRRVQRPRLRRVLDALGGVPVLGVAPEIIESIVAWRQVHPSLFAIDGGAKTEVYAHEEPNAINPLLFIAHYSPGRDSLLGRDVTGPRVHVGVETVASDLQDAGAPLDPSPTARRLLDARSADARGILAETGGSE